jgi:anti-anti-sigma factor
VSELLRIRVNKERTPLVVTVSGKILYDTQAQLAEILAALAERPDPRILLDLTAVPMCDSSALNLLVQTHSRASVNGGWLRLVGARPLVRKVLAVTNLGWLLPVYDSAEEAVVGTSGN